MIFYHGSKNVITSPIHHGSKPFNDYGPSFYLTLDKESAKEWACRNDSIGIVNKYEIPGKRFSSLKVLDLTEKQNVSILNWLAILMHFREVDSNFKRTYAQRFAWLERYYIDVTEYDVIKGFRADDAYFRFPLRFISGDLSFDDLEQVYLSGNLGIQYAFHSQKAIDALRFCGSENVDESFVGTYFERIVSATSRFNDILLKPLDINLTYITDLMKKEQNE